MVGLHGERAESEIERVAEEQVEVEEEQVEIARSGAVAVYEVNASWVRLLSLC